MGEINSKRAVVLKKTIRRRIISFFQGFARIQFPGEKRRGGTPHPAKIVIPGAGAFHGEVDLEDQVDLWDGRFRG